MSPGLNIRPADIVLTRSRGLSASLNRAGQFILTGRFPGFTHAAICLVPDVIIDARPFEDVRLRSMFEEVRSGRLDTARMGKRDIFVLRNDRLSSSREVMDDTAISLVRPLYRQLRKTYNWFFQLPQSSDSDPQSEEARAVFCTELCVLLLHSLNVTPANWLPASGVLPVDFEALLNHGWSDVTESWINEIGSLSRALASPDSEHARLVMPREQTAELWIKETEGWAAVSEQVKSLDHVAQQLDDLLSRVKHRFPE